MSEDNLFRLIIVAMAVVLLPIGICHRVKSTTDEKLDRRQEGVFMMIGLRVVGWIGWFGLFAYLINPQWMAWAAVPLPLWLRWLGVGLLLLAGMLQVWTMCTLGPNLTDTVVTRKDHTLVTNGPYRWVRHPFYLAALLMTPAVALAAANLFIFVIGIAIYVLLAIRSGREEQNLILRFGDDYRNYMKRTGRFLPRLF